LLASCNARRLALCQRTSRVLYSQFSHAIVDLRYLLLPTIYERLQARTLAILWLLVAVSVLGFLCLAQQQVPLGPFSSAL
jgi:hypothetical protein